MTGKPTILILLRHYLPGYKSGGPVRTIANMIDIILADYFNILIITSDRDALDKVAYPNVKVNQWNTVGKAQVFYCSPKRVTMKIFKILRKTPYDIIYINSLFDLTYSIFPIIARYLFLIPKRPLIIAPRGELSKGAIKIKSIKKKLFLLLSKLLGLHKKLIWQASSEFEKQDIERELGNMSKKIIIASDIANSLNFHNKKTPYKFRDKGSPLRLIFLSRITRKKNLHFALEILSGITIPICFDIFGPIGDTNYWEKCLKIIELLPNNVKVTYKGYIENSEVQNKMSLYDLFFLPTSGENYGHVISEALSAGTPVLISDKTPWRNLESHNAGWDLSLDLKDAFIECIEIASLVSEKDMLKWRSNVLSYFNKVVNTPQTIKANLNLFLDIIKK